MIRIIAIISLSLLLAGCISSAQPAAPWPSDRSAPPIPAALGVNIHFTDPAPGELAMLAGAGFCWVRMDFVWQDTEVEKGKYDFSGYDRLMTALDQHHLRALFILDYTNRLYDGDHAPYSNEGRAAFANWASAAVKHFRGRGIVWEIYNEPNTGFWTPQPNVSDYVKLALVTSKAIHQVAPEAQLIGPGVWGFDLKFVEECLRAGLLDYWSAVSVHPYRKNDPESVVDDFVALRSLVQKYAPAGKRVNIMASEWGYSSAAFNVGPEMQAALLARQLLINQSQGIALSIWYDWRDDGRDPRQIEHHFGTVLPTKYSQRTPPYDPKPAYRAMQTLSRFLKDCQFDQRLTAPELRPDDYVLAFRCDGANRYAVWTTSQFDHRVRLKFPPGTYRVVTSANEQTLQCDSTGLPLTLTTSPQYLEIRLINSLD